MATLGSYFSAEQPGSSVMFCLRRFPSLVNLGASVTRVLLPFLGHPLHVADAVASQQALAS